MIITTLIENTCMEGQERLTAQHGLSLHIAWGDKQILFDSGPSEAFWTNAEALGVDLRGVDMAVISHHHYDHGGGLGRFLQGNPNAKVYLRRYEGGDLFARRALVFWRYIGLDKSLFERYPQRFEFVSQESEIMPGVFILTQIDKPYPLPRGNDRLYVRRGLGGRRDTFDHELLMVIRDAGRLVVISGCSHQGILNMVETVIKRFPGEPIQALLGGLHLMADAERDVRQVGERLLAYPIESVYAGHCTGLESYRILKDVMGERLEYLSTGRVITL